MNTGKLIRQGKYWKIESKGFKQPMSIFGDFGFTDDMINQEIEFDNSGGTVKKVTFNGIDFTNKGSSQSKQTAFQTDYSGNKKNDQTFENTPNMNPKFK